MATALYKNDGGDQLLGAGEQWWVITDHDESDIDSGNLIAIVKTRKMAATLCAGMDLSVDKVY